PSAAAVTRQTIAPEMAGLGIPAPAARAAMRAAAAPRSPRIEAEAKPDGARRGSRSGERSVCPDKSRSPFVGEVVANQSQFPVVTSDTQSEAQQIVWAGNNAVGLQPVSAMAQRKV